jgi:hypothetical protein
MKALSAYSSKFSSWEGSRKMAWESNMMPTFKIESFWENIDDFFDKVDRDDIIDDLASRKQNGVSIKDWSPYKLEGFHSLHLEKAMRYRYANYGEDGFSNIKNAYKTESIQAGDRQKLASETYSAIHSWEYDSD